eukprot:6909829-Prymnesium_polylepis.1
MVFTKSRAPGGSVEMPRTTTDRPSPEAPRGARGAPDTPERRAERRSDVSRSLYPRILDTLLPFSDSGYKIVFDKIRFSVL